MATRAARGFGQYSGVARALERVGERWALLIVRDLLVGARRYGDLKAGLPLIPTNILADRLKELQEAGVVRRVPVRVQTLPLLLDPAIRRGRVLGQQAEAPFRVAAVAHPQSQTRRRQFGWHRRHGHSVRLTTRRGAAPRTGEAADRLCL